MYQTCGAWETRVHITNERWKKIVDISYKGTIAIQSMRANETRKKTEEKAEKLDMAYGYSY